MATAGKVSGLVIQALRHLSPQHVDDNVVGALRRRLNSNDKKQLLNDIRYAPAWIGGVLRQIAETSTR